MANIRKLRPLSDTRGTAFLDFSLVLPLLLILTLGVMDFGRLFWTKMTMSRAASAAARCFAMNSNTCPSADTAQTYASQQAWGTSNVTFNAATAACGAQVTATYNFTFIVPWWPGANPLALSTTTCYPRQY
jgi:Flp pilus assembly protein TadG